MKHLFLHVLTGGVVVCSPLYAQNRQPNIVFVMADDLGWNDLGMTGSDYYETPHIDRLASEGAFFDNAYAAAANSAPSRACLMTGLYTPRHGVYTVSPSARGDKSKRKLIPIENKEEVRTDFVTLGEALHQQGYVCAHIGKWHLGSDLDGSKTGPLSQGFDYNIAGDRAGSPYSYFYPYCEKGKCHLGLDKGTEGEYLTDRLTDEAIKFVSLQKEKPFFLYMAHHAVHTPLKAPQALIDKYQKKAKGVHHTNPVYAAMVENLDWNVGRLCHALDSLGLSENTLFVFYSDNGGSEPVTDNFSLRGGKGMPYEGGIKVPLILKYPGKIKPGTVVDDLVTGVDFYPTLLTLAGGIPAAGLDGENIFNQSYSETSKQRALYWHFPAYLEGYQGMDGAFRATPHSIIRLGDWKLIYYYEDQSMELFCLKEDPMEKNNQAVSQPEKAKELYDKLSRWLKETQADIPIQLNPDYGGRK
ncbi:sulfatase [Bacteroides neonati]|uniref:sulfatase n=1 Tax=Bacteroides neonati TaxID=1347393 RepID=UPI0004BB2BA8|nr:sulfatase [Bacteroides neonati]